MTDTLSKVGRIPVVTAYALAFGSLLLPGGRASPGLRPGAPAPVPEAATAGAA